jgi:hypothetical protein
VYPAASLEERLLDEALRYAWFAERYHWSPDVVDNLPAHVEARLPTVAQVVDEVAEAEQKRAARAVST